MPEIDKLTLELLDRMGFNEEPKKRGLYSTIIHNGIAFIDFRTEDGRRYANLGGKNIQSKDADTIEILRAFKERRDEIKNKLLNDLGASQSSPKDGKEVHDTTKGKDSKPEDEHILNHAARSGQSGESLKKSPQDSLSSKDDIQTESQNNKQDSQKTKVEGETVLEKTTPHTPKDGVKTAPPPISIQEQPPEPPGASHSKNVFLDEIIPAYEIDICELFGGAGDGKSRVVKKIAEDALERGMKVRYIDTERGFLKSDLRKLGESYQYIPNLKGVFDLIHNMPKGIDLFILDSIGYPVLTEWAKMPVNERGNALTQIIAIKDFIKDWAISNNKVAIIINQPDSDFGKGEGYVNRPFGDKGQFVIKEVFLIKRISSTTSMTKSVIESFRSRHDARGVRIANVEITNEGVKII